MNAFAEALWYGTIFPVLVVGHLVLNAIEMPTSFLVGLTDEPHQSREVAAPIYHTVGPTYTSTKIDFPGTTQSLWIYGGDEPEMDINAEPDADTYAYKFTEVRDSVGLKGSESGELCRHQKFGY